MAHYVLTQQRPSLSRSASTVSPQRQLVPLRARAWLEDWQRQGDVHRPGRLATRRRRRIPAHAGNHVRARQSRLHGRTQTSHRPNLRAHRCHWTYPAKDKGCAATGAGTREHALERMAPNTLEARALMPTRVQARFERLGLEPGDPMYDKSLTRMVKGIDPRGIPPSVAAEMPKPGSTNVKVIATNRGERVIAVMPK
jgi:hypothetical protein